METISIAVAQYLATFVLFKKCIDFQNYGFIIMNWNCIAISTEGLKNCNAGLSGNGV